MLLKVNSIDTIKNEVKVTLLDIDDYGSVNPLKDLELNIPADESVIQTLKNSSYAAIFTEGNIEENSNTITISALNTSNLSSMLLPSRATITI